MRQLEGTLGATCSQTMSRDSYNDVDLDEFSAKRYIPVRRKDLVANIYSTLFKLLWPTPSRGIV